MICKIKDFCFNGTIRQARNAARILIFSNEIEECKRIIEVSSIIESKEIMSSLSGETNRLVSRFAALNQFAKHLFRECEPYIQDLTKSLFTILGRHEEQESAKECHEWLDFLALCPEGKVKALSIKILANGVMGTKSTGTLFYSFLQFFERMVDSEGEYNNEVSTLYDIFYNIRPGVQCHLTLTVAKSLLNIACKDELTKWIPPLNIVKLSLVMQVYCLEE
jgi:hypothetical protein